MELWSYHDYGLQMESRCETSRFGYTERWGRKKRRGTTERLKKKKIFGTDCHCQLRGMKSEASSHLS